MPKPIRFEIIADERDAKRAFASVDRGISGLGRAATVGGAAIAAGLAAGGAALVRIGQTFEDVRGNITRGTGAIGEQLEVFVDNAKAVLQQVPDTADVVSVALADVNTFFGVTGDQLEKTTEQFLDFARLTGADVSTAIDKVDGLMTQFGESVENTDEVLGDLIRISQATGLEMETLLNQAQTFGPIFSNANFSLEETVAIMGQLQQAGVDMTRVGPALNAFFRRTAAAGEDPQRAFHDIVAEIGNAENSTIALNAATEAFGSEGAQRMVSAIRSGTLSLEDLNDLIGDGTGLLEEQTEATETFSDKWDQFKNRVLVGLEPIATAFLDALGEGLDRLGTFFAPLLDEGEKWLGWAEDNLLPIWDRAKDAGQDAIDEIVRFFRDWRRRAQGDLDTIEGAFRKVWGFLEGAFADALDSLKEAWEEIGVLFEDLGTSRGEVLRNTLTGIVVALAAIVLGIGAFIAAVIKLVAFIVGGIDDVLRAVRNLRNWIDRLIEKWEELRANLQKAIKVPGLDRITQLIPGTGGPTGRGNNPFDFPLIPGFGRRRAMGVSSHPGGPVTINEGRRTETLDAPPGTRINPHYMGGSGGDTYIIQGSNLTAGQVAREINWRRRIGDGR